MSSDIASQPGRGVLNQEHLDKLNQAESQLVEAQRQLELAQSAGIDTGNAQELITKYQGQIRALKQTYFPGQ